MLTRKQMEDAANCEKEIGNADFDYQEKMCKKCSCSDGHGRCAATFEAAQTALALANMLEEITDTLDTVTDIIDESGEWGNINAQTTIKTLDKAKALLKEMEG